MMTMRKIVSKACKDIGLTKIETAPDGSAAWDIIKKGEPEIQLVISDWNMPNLTGLELLKKVRADEATKNLPFLLVTAEAEEGQVTEAVQSGVDNYVVKPFAANTLREKLDLVFKKFQARMG